MILTGREATPGTIFTIVSFGLLLIVTLITPIIKQLYFVKITRNNDELTIGLWGYCIQNGGESMDCTSPKIGFAFNAKKALNRNFFADLPGPVNSTLSYLVVVHIVALITLSIVTCVGTFAHTRENRDKGLIKIAAQSSALALIFVLFAFIVDFILFNNEIVKPINNKETDYLAEFDTAYYLMIACLVSSGLATISFIVGRIMNKRRKPEDESFDDKESDGDDYYSEPQYSEPHYSEPHYSEPRMNEDFRDQDHNQNFPVEDVDAIKQSAQFPPLGSEYIPPNPYPMGPYQGRGPRPTSPNSGHPLPPQFPYLPPSQSPNYPTNSPPMYPPDSYPFSSNLPYDAYPNSNNSNIYREYPPQSSQPSQSPQPSQSSQQWQPHNNNNYY